ncbi:hypothetical protein [Paracraurococcus lichenis]|uniref:Uncharacterized protein n=1 Tax=Paracraurococcus lichenis TaxID=3064888 RepID=A0ABT9E7L1_9PROT|nr:hypothetical protein [Paracraurococcus sp. LOR1-02]MDO9712191.1 hypothetical protein [Paracraurococcus sp. LOR1-02]
MEPLKPMPPMQPLDFSPAWWPEGLGQPASSGGQNDIHYAFFPDARRLAIKQGGKVTLYDTGSHRISGVSQRRGADHSPTFTDQFGEVSLAELKQVG